MWAFAATSDFAPRQLMEVYLLASHRLRKQSLEACDVGITMRHPAGHSQYVGASIDIGIDEPIGIQDFFDITYGSQPTPK
jgi:uncharacterized protein YcsI (UPF0317 family)